MMQNRSLILKEVPSDSPKKGQHLVIEDRPIDSDLDPPHNGLLVQNIYLSYDPYQRGRMREASIQSYSPAYPLDEPIVNSGIAKVLKSANSKYAANDLIINYMSEPFQEYSVLDAKSADGENVWKIDNPLGLDPINFLGPLGMSGLTAYSSLYEIGQPKKGETIFISAASGSVGSMVGQLAKREGLQVIGSVGDDRKLEYILNELGFDEGFNYKKEAPMDALTRLAPQGIHIYFDNVGGNHLEAALASLQLFGRIVVCGMISDYDKPFEHKYGVRNLQLFFEKRLRMQGFIVADFQDKYYEEHQRNVQQWLKEGTLQAKICKTIGMDNAIDGLLGLFSGHNFGKAVLQVAKL